MNGVHRTLVRDARQWQKAVDAELGSRGESTRRFRSRRRVGGFAAVAAVLVIAAGLALLAENFGGSGGGNNPTAAGQTDPLTPSPPADIAAIPEVVPTPLSAATASTLTSMPWRLLSVTNGGTKLSIYYVAGDGDCVQPRGLYLSETASSVLLGVYSHTDPNRPACGSALVMQKTTLTLSTALGARSLIHTQVADAWSDPKFFS